MSDYLSRLVARTFGQGSVVRPRVPARFESPTGHDPGNALEVEAVDRAATPPANWTTIGIADATKPDTSQARAETGTRPRNAETLQPGRSLAPPAIEQPVVAHVSSDPDGGVDVERRVETFRDTPVLTEPVAPAPAGQKESAADRTSSVTRWGPDQTALRPQSSPPAEKPSIRHPAAGLPDADGESKPGRPITRSTTETPSGRATSRADARSAVTTASDGTEASTIRVHIGRIEVRAVMDPPRSRPQPTVPKPVSTLALKDYLRKRSQDRR